MYYVNPKNISQHYFVQLLKIFSNLQYYKKIYQEAGKFINLVALRLNKPITIPHFQSYRLTPNLPYFF